MYQKEHARAIVWRPWRRKTRGWLQRWNALPTWRHVQRQTRSRALPDSTRKSSSRCRCPNVTARATPHQQAGNNAFHQQQYAAAIQHYDAAIALGVDDARLAAVLHCNKAAALHEQGQYVDAVVQCCVAESHNPGYSRAFQRRAEAYAALGDFAAALRV